jgi:catechol 2,3-dioxygenase-like lactoylglutathione lyase family enzyme
MFDHIALHVNDLDASTRFYTAALAPLGHVLCSRDETSASFGSPEAPALWLYLADQSTRANGKRQAHLAFSAASHALVERFHADGQKAGGSDNVPPGLLLDYGPTYYAAFLLDPDGNNVEAVCP